MFHFLRAAIFRPKLGIFIERAKGVDDPTEKILAMIAAHFATEIPDVKTDWVDTCWAKFKLQGETIHYYIDNYTCEIRFSSSSSRDSFFDAISTISDFKCRKIESTLK